MRKLLDFFESAEAAWNAPFPHLFVAGLDARTADALVSTRQTLDLDKEMAQLEKAGVRALTWESEDYPARLLEVDDAPPVLYALGEFSESDKWAVGIVGTRRLTAYGREATDRLAAGLAEAGVSVVSGLARGIDTI